VHTLRVQRAQASAFEPRFFERSERFWPIARAAANFAHLADWPQVSEYGRAFDAEPPVRFVVAAPRPRRQRRAGRVDPKALYDARITLERCVPTRPRTWHDFMNALVWATFPRAKRALHERQLRALASRIPAGATRLPGTRSREHDALALLDEGGVVVLEAPEAPPLRIVFGHALYEGLVLGVRAMVARAVIAPVACLPEGARERVGLGDAVLEARLRAPDLAPEALPRIAL
jgi:hypothetical protein